MTKQEQMFSLVQQQEQSGLTIGRFCTEHNLKLNTFHYWRKRYKETNSSSKGFIAIRSFAHADASAPIRVSYPNGVNVDLSSADLSLIVSLIRVF